MSAMKWMALVLAVWVSPLAHATTVEYVHTDGLGSVVAVSNAAGEVIERREYEPYGHQLTPALADGPGYTGHVQDAATGLTYMQQRYYDPALGVFLSVDPITVEVGGLRHFNRYAYAYNNPHKFTDPDGQWPCAATPPAPVCLKAGAAAVTTYRTWRAARLVAQVVQTQNEAAEGTGESNPESESSGARENGGRTPAPFLPDDPYSPEEVSRRQSQTREDEGAPSRDPDSQIPDRGPGRDAGGHEARGRTPHDTGERNVNRHEEHSRRPKGNPTGRH